jgi:predicted SprT family Zn-dependent metalloprotease
VRTHRPTRAAVPVPWRRLLRRWTRLWGLPGLEDALTITFSPRLQRALGRCVPAQGRITLHTSLASARVDKVAAVLCHEAAHVGAFMLHGRRIRPHGAEWAALVQSAGFLPHVSVRRRAVTGTAQAQHSPAFRFEHRCPVCHNQRWARRSVPQWRCAECVAAGLEGRFVVIKHLLEPRFL